MINTNTYTLESNSVESITNELESSVDFFISNEDTISLPTPYVILEYPAKWDGIVITEAVKNESTYIIKFHAYLEYQYVALFDFVIGNSSEGIVLGNINTVSGERPVYLIDYSANSGNHLSQESKEIYFQMSVDVNIIISNLIYNSGMRV